MARPTKRRKVCGMPRNQRFGPMGNPSREKEMINLSIDEYETIRLIDLEGYTQAECAEQMNVARTTVQGIYSNARKKIAESVVNGKILNIHGGNYKICNGQGPRCRRRACNRRIDKMKITIPVDNNVNSNVNENLGRTPFFYIRDMETDEIEFINNEAAKSQGGAGVQAAQMIIDQGTRVLLAPKVGKHAEEILKTSDIQVFQTEGKDIEENIQKYKDGNLKRLI